MAIDGQKAGLERIDRLVIIKYMDKQPVRINNDSMTKRMGEFGNDEAFMVSLMAELADERNGRYPNAFDMKFALKWNDWGYSASETQNFAVVATTPRMQEAVVISKKGMLLIRKAESHERFEAGLPANLDLLIKQYDWKKDNEGEQSLQGIGIHSWKTIDVNNPDKSASWVIRESEEYWKGRKNGGVGSAEGVAKGF